MTIQEFASHYSKMFIRDIRDDGTEYVKTIDERPEELTELIYKAHGGMVPDDWRYKFIEESLDRIAETEDEDDLDCPELEPDIYTYDLLQWLVSRNDRYDYVDQATEEYGHGDSLIEDIMLGQIKEREEVYFSVLSSLRKIKENIEEELRFSGFLR